MKILNIALSIIMIIILDASGMNANPRRIKGQSLYLPVYSHIYYGDRGQSILLSTTISIRNIDASKTITLISIDYYDSDGRLIEKLQSVPTTINPLGTVRFLIAESDKRGGSGAKCVIRWRSDSSVLEPLVESIMIGTRLQQGISFTSRAVVLDESD